MLFVICYFLLVICCWLLVVGYLLTGAVARQRTTNNNHYFNFPKRYREWRLKAQGEILMQIHRMSPPPQLPLRMAALRIFLSGNHRGDGDNAIDSVCDALVSAGVLPSDSLKYLPYGSWRHINSEETGV
ncbi:RusA family crossover junction endodeoxyribonuclease [Planktothricoides sp. FACHB-1261]|nr:RusA family crossover junction endodeoxyribonuclease [Planktothricoides raciborskii FACHB-1261]